MGILSSTSLSFSIGVAGCLSELEVHWSKPIVANVLTTAGIGTSYYITLMYFAPVYKTTYDSSSVLCFLCVDDYYPRLSIYQSASYTSNRAQAWFSCGGVICERGQPHCCDVWCCCCLCGVGVERPLNQWYWKQVCIINSSKQWLMGYCQVVREG